MTHHRIRSTFGLRFIITLLLFAVVNGIGQPAAIAETEPRNPKGIEIPSESAEGRPVALVHVHLPKSTGDAAQDEAFKKQVKDAFGTEAGDPFRRLMVEMGLKQVRKLASVQSVEFKVYEAVPSGQIVVAIFATPYLEEMKVPKKPSGMLVSKQIGDFPTIFENDRSKFVFILNGGAGIYSDTNPWFGGYGELFNKNSPISKDPLVWCP